MKVKIMFFEVIGTDPALRRGIDSAQGKVILMGYMFDVEGFYERFVSKVREYDDQIPDAFFEKSETFARRKHIETLATAMNEWFFE